MGLESLEEASARIDSSLRNLKLQTEEDIKRNEALLDRYNREHKAALADGDLRENASFEEAIKNIQTVNADIASADGQISGIVTVLNTLERYRSTGRVQQLSTVRIKRCDVSGSSKELTNVEDEYVFKLFPYGISNFKLGILSLDSVVGAALFDKTVGDKIKIRNRAGERYAYYEITEIL